MSEIFTFESQKCSLFLKELWSSFDQKRKPVLCAGQKTDSSKTFSQKATEYVLHAQGCLGRLLDDLREGSVRIQTLQLLMSYHDRFLDLVEANGDDKTSVAAVLQIRNHEMQIYISTAAHLDGLLEYCRQYLKTGVDMAHIVDTSSLHSVLTVATSSLPSVMSVVTSSHPLFCPVCGHLFCSVSGHLFPPSFCLWSLLPIILSCLWSSLPSFCSVCGHLFPSFCPVCGHLFPPSFCPVCGHLFPPSFCSVCGHLFPPSFCPVCGHLFPPSFCPVCLPSFILSCLWTPLPIILSCLWTPLPIILSCLWTPLPSFILSCLWTPLPSFILSCLWTPLLSFILSCLWTPLLSFILSCLWTPLPIILSCLWTPLPSFILSCLWTPLPSFILSCLWTPLPSFILSCLWTPLLSFILSCLWTPLLSFILSCLWTPLPIILSCLWTPLPSIILSCLWTPLPIILSCLWTPLPSIILSCLWTPLPIILSCLWTPLPIILSCLWSPLPSIILVCLWSPLPSFILSCLVTSFHHSVLSVVISSLLRSVLSVVTSSLLHSALFVVTTSLQSLLSVCHNFCPTLLLKDGTIDLFLEQVRMEENILSLNNNQNYIIYSFHKESEDRRLCLLVSSIQNWTLLSGAHSGSELKVNFYHLEIDTLPLVFHTKRNGRLICTHEEADAIRVRVLQMVTPKTSWQRRILSRTWGRECVLSESSLGASWWGKPEEKQSVKNSTHTWKPRPQYVRAIRVKHSHCWAALFTHHGHGCGAKRG